MSGKSRKSGTSSKMSWNKFPGVTDTEDEEDEDDDNDEDNAGRKSRVFVRPEPARSTNSIPSRMRRYALVKYPQIDMEYRLPNSPEKYLLPVRFPIMYKKILSSIDAIKADRYEIRMNRFNIRSGLMCSVKNQKHSPSAQPQPQLS
jgi:hypothetical protein